MVRFHIQLVKTKVQELLFHLPLSSGVQCHCNNNLIVELVEKAYSGFKVPECNTIVMAETISRLSNSTVGNVGNHFLKTRTLRTEQMNLYGQNKMKSSQIALRLAFCNLVQDKEFRIQSYESANYYNFLHLVFHLNRSPHTVS